jgi:hypothetical protein
MAGSAPNPVLLGEPAMSERPTITTLSSGSPIETVLDTVEHDGGAIVEGLLQTDLLRKLNAELDAEIDTQPAGSQRETSS